MSTMTCNASQMMPLQVYILAGQSNMLGFADIKTIPYIGMDPDTAPLLDYIRSYDDNDNDSNHPDSFRTCDNVLISVIGSKNSDEDERHGRLGIGYGANHEKLGPELWFGLTLEQKFGTQQPILIIKTAWGGKSLHTDFRPPSAGPFVFPPTLLEQFKRKGQDLDKVQAEKKEATGTYYNLMMKHIRHVLRDIPRVFPGYNSDIGYEISGFVWFQGWNDVVDSGVYHERNKPGGYDEYGRLLSLLVQDVRNDLATPKLPFVIGVIGVHGPRDDNHLHAKFRKAMEIPAQQEELQPIAAIRTESFWDFEIEELDQKWNEKVQKRANAIKEEQNLGREEFRRQLSAIAEEVFSPEELLKYKTGKSNAAYHYFGSAKFMARAGQAFAEAVYNLQPQSQ